jgi:uncharacterized protein (DUF952 family)
VIHKGFSFMGFQRLSSHVTVSSFAFHMRRVYKIIDRDEWDAARSCGRYSGSADDKRDGFIHLSTAGQMRETAAKHFAGQRDMVLLAVKADALGDALKWETSRGGALFPHLYGSLRVSTVSQSWPLPLDDNGVHEFPKDAE